jgi:cytochrome c biogenesis protein CcdA
LSELAELLRSALSGGSVLALPVAVLGGVITGLNPCCLPLYPAAAGACCAVRGERMAFSNALSFVAGIAVATAALGIVAAMAGRILAGLGGWTVYAIAVLPLAMGAHLLGWVRLPMPSSHVVGHHRGMAGAFVAGLLIWLVFAPCATPVLAAVLSYAAYEGSVAGSEPESRCLLWERRPGDWLSAWTPWGGAGGLTRQPVRCFSASASTSCGSHSW